MKSLNKIIVLLFFCSCLASCCFFRGNKSAHNIKRVILIGWDGTQRSRLKEMLAQSKLPNLKQLISEGSLIDLNIFLGDTSTKAGWAEILTGLGPVRTGVYKNRVEYKPIPLGYTIFERLEEYFGKENIATVFLAGKKHNLGSRGPHKVWPKGPKGIWYNEYAWGKYALKQKDIRKMEGEPYMLAKTRIDYFENGLGKAEQVGPKILNYIKKLKDERFFIFVQFEEPDELGHAFGEQSTPYSKGLIMNDRWLGKIVELLKILKLYDNTLIYVVSDHGFSKGAKEHNYAPETFLATNDRRIKKKTAGRKDIAPTILRRLGLNIKDLNPPLEGHSLY